LPYREDLPWSSEKALLTASGWSNWRQERAYQAKLLFAGAFATPVGPTIQIAISQE
jgi:hypothetical protein